MRTLGYADTRTWEIVVNDNRTLSQSTLRSILLHEAVHLAGYPRHDRGFKRALVEAVGEGYGVDISRWERWPYLRLQAAVDWAIWWAGWRDRGCRLWTSASRRFVARERTERGAAR